MAYSYYRTLTVDHTKVGLTGAPGTSTFFVDVTLNAAHVTSASGYDVVFGPNANGSSPYPFELVNYNSGTGQWIGLVQVPTPSHTVDTVLYCTYGDATVTTFQGGSTGAAWDSGFQGVYHLPDGSSLTALDSTANAANGTNHSAAATATNVQSFGGASFNGSSSNIQLGSGTVTSTDNQTVEFWVYETTRSANAALYTANQSVLNNEIFSNNGVISYVQVGTASIVSLGYTLPLNTLTHLAFVTSGTQGVNLAFYVNGILQTSVTDQQFCGQVLPAILGAWSNTGTASALYFAGKFDEVRFHNVSRSADWVYTSFNSQNQNNSAFYTLGSEQSFSTSVNLTGVSGTGTLGAFNVTTGGNATVNLTGVSGIGSAGTWGIILSPNISLSGVSGTGAVGTISPQSAGLIIPVIAPYLAGDSIGTKTFQLYEVIAGVLTAIGSAVTTGFTAIPNITNGWMVEIQVAPNGSFGDFAGIAVFGNINGSDARAVAVNSPPTSTATSIVQCALPDGWQIDLPVITTPGYQLYDKTGAAFGSHVTAGILAIPGVADGYVARIALTPDANGGTEYYILWDGG